MTAGVGGGQAVPAAPSASAGHGGASAVILPAAISPRPRPPPASKSEPESARQPWNSGRAGPRPVGLLPPREAGPRLPGPACCSGGRRVARMRLDQSQPAARSCPVRLTRLPRLQSPALQPAQPAPPRPSLVATACRGGYTQQGCRASAGPRPPGAGPRVLGGGEGPLRGGAGTRGAEAESGSERRLCHCRGGERGPSRRDSDGLGLVTPGSGPDQVRRRARPARRLSASQRGGLTAGAARPRRAGSAAPRLGDSATPPLSAGAGPMAAGALAAPGLSPPSSPAAPPVSAPPLSLARPAAAPHPFTNSPSHIAGGLRVRATSESLAA